MLFPPISNFIGNQIANSEADKFDTIVENVVDNGKSYEDALKDKEIDEEGYPVDTDGNRTSDTPVYYKKDLDRLLKDSREYNENLKENQSSLLVDEYAYSVPSLNLKKLRNLQRHLRICVGSHNQYEASDLPRREQR